MGIFDNMQLNTNINTNNKSFSDYFSLPLPEFTPVENLPYLVPELPNQTILDGLSRPLADSIKKKQLKEKPDITAVSKGPDLNKVGNAMSYVGMASDMLSGFLPEKSEYSGDSGDLAQTLDATYDSISNAAMSFGPIGAIVGGAMKGANLLGKGFNALGGGTDGMTTQDSILGSSFFNWNIGLINGFGGKKADIINKNNLAFETVGSSYLGTNDIVDDALTKSGKKYGLFSNSARKQANREIAKANQQQNIMSDIADEALDRFAIKDSMSAINSNRRAFNMRGGYNQGSVRIGRNGFSTETILKAKRIISTFKYKNGGKTQDTFEYYLSTLPENQRDSSHYRVKDYWEFNGKPKDFNEALEKNMFTFNEKDGTYHAHSVAENPKTGEIEFMKSPNHSTTHMESDWYEKGLIYNDDGSITQLAPGMEGFDEWQSFIQNWDLQKPEPYWKYVRKNNINSPFLLNEISLNDIPEFKDGGLLEVSFDSISEEYLKPYTLNEISLDDIPEFKEGGTLKEELKTTEVEETIQKNVIPEGALHARLHHMENADNLTKKGIPVVSEKENGELEQQAEIERDEVIFRLEVTKKIEELRNKYNDSDISQSEKDTIAIEAGKLLAYELLENTVDNTGLLNTIS